MTYHPGKVLKTISPGDKGVKSADESVQATVEMWDGNIFTFLVVAAIQSDVSEGDVVLVDYRPNGKLPVANQNIVKVLKGDPAKELWGHYQEFHNSRQKKAPPTMSMPQPSYMG